MDTRVPLPSFAQRVRRQIDAAHLDAQAMQQRRRLPRPAAEIVNLSAAAHGRTNATAPNSTNNTLATLARTFIVIASLVNALLRPLGRVGVGLLR